jgi:hypothetical protein
LLLLAALLLGIAAVLLAMLLPNEPKFATPLLMLCWNASCMRDMAATAPVSRTGLLDRPPLLLLLPPTPAPADTPPCDMRFTLASGVTRRKPPDVVLLLLSASSFSWLLLPNGASSPCSPPLLLSLQAAASSRLTPHSGLLLLLLAGLLPVLLLYSDGDRDSPAGAAAA